MNAITRKTARALLILVVFLASVAHAAAPGAGKRAAGRGAGGVQGILAAGTEQDKARLFTAQRHQLTPADVLTIVQNERSDMIATMAVGVYLERLQVEPREAATILHTLAHHPGLSGIAATLAAASRDAGPIAGALLALDSRSRQVNPRLLAADVLATHAWILSRLGSVEAAGSTAEPTGTPEPAARGRKRGGKRRAERIGQPGEDLVAPLNKLLSSKEPEVLEAALLAAAWLRCEAARPAVESLGESRVPGVIAARLLYLARTGGPVPAELVHKIFGQRPVVPPRYTEPSPALSSYEIRTAPWVYACEALGDLRGKTYLPQLLEALDCRDLRVQFEAAEALEKLGAAESLPALLKKVESSRTAWPVLVHVLLAVGAVPAREAVPVLIQRLGKERGRLRLDVNYALASIAGSQAGTTAEEWKAWWDQNAASFAVSPGKTAAFRREHAVQDMRAESLGWFYNLDLYSDRLVFVVDTSNSMRGERISSLQHNLTTTLQGLKPHVLFNVVDFGGQLAVMKPTGLISRAEISHAVQRVEKFTLSGGTRTYDALELATQLPDVDTLVLLSDGAPVSGKFDAWSRITAAIGVLNRYRPIAIWGLEFLAKEKNLGAMMDLTDHNWGRTRSSQP